MPSLGKSIRHARQKAEPSMNDVPASVHVTLGNLASWEQDLEARLRQDLLRLSLQFPDLTDIFKTREEHG